MVVVGYVRFKGGKTKAPADSPTLETAVSSLEIPHVEFEAPERGRPHETVAGIPTGGPIRDIFAPPSWATQKERAVPKKAPSKPIASLKLELRGVILSGDEPLAIINDRFVRTGDRIGNFRVVRIEKTEVVLDSGKQKRTIRMVRDE